MRERSLCGEGKEETREIRVPPTLAMFGTGTESQVNVKKDEGFSPQIELSIQISLELLNHLAVSAITYRALCMYQALYEVLRI